MINEPYRLLDISTCHHGKPNDGGMLAVPEGASFSFPACGRQHVATIDKYPVDPQYLREEAKAQELRARAAHARAMKNGAH